MYKQAIRDKLRWKYVGTELKFNGEMSVEKLADLSVEDLDLQYQDLQPLLEQSAKHSLLTAATSANKTLQLKIDIIKDLVVTKQAEAKAKEDLKAAKAQKDHLATLVQDANDVDLRKKIEGMSADERAALLAG